MRLTRCEVGLKIFKKNVFGGAEQDFFVSNLWEMWGTLARGRFLRTNDKQDLKSSYIIIKTSFPYNIVCVLYEYFEIFEKRPQHLVSYHNEKYYVHEP